MTKILCFVGIHNYVSYRCRDHGNCQKCFNCNKIKHKPHKLIIICPGCGANITKKTRKCLLCKQSIGWCGIAPFIILPPDPICRVQIDNEAEYHGGITEYHGVSHTRGDGDAKLPLQNKKEIIMRLCRTKEYDYGNSCNGNMPEKSTI